MPLAGMVIRGSGRNLIGELITQSPELVFLIQICSIILPIRVVGDCQDFHHPDEDAFVAPPLPAIIERLCRIIIIARQANSSGASGEAAMLIVSYRTLMASTVTAPASSTATSVLSSRTVLPVRNHASSSIRP